MSTTAKNLVLIAEEKEMNEAEVELIDKLIKNKIKILCNEFQNKLNAYKAGNKDITCEILLEISNEIFVFQNISIKIKNMFTDY